MAAATLPRRRHSVNVNTPPPLLPCPSLTGAGNGDAYTNMLMTERKQNSLRDCRKTGPITMRLPKLPAAPPEIEVDNIFLPSNTLLQAHGEVAQVRGWCVGGGRGCRVYYGVCVDVVYCRQVAQVRGCCVCVCVGGGGGCTTV